LEANKSATPADRKGVLTLQVPADVACKPDGQKRVVQHDALFDGMKHSQHTVHNKHKENAEEAQLKANLDAAAGDPVKRSCWACRLREFYDRMKRGRVIMESERSRPITQTGCCFSGQDGSDQSTFQFPNAGQLRLNTALTECVGGNAYTHSVMCQIFNSHGKRVVQYIVVPPHIKPGSNMAMTARMMLHETLAANDVELATEVFHLTDSGSDEVSLANVAYNAIHIVGGKVSKFTHGRGDVGHNHTFLDLLGALAKRRLKGNRRHVGTPTFVTADLVELLEAVAADSNPGAICCVKIMHAAYDFSNIVNHATAFAGQADHRMMTLHKDSSSGAVMARIYRDLASKLPQSVILQAGGIASEFEILKSGAETFCDTPLDMAPHSVEGTAAANTGMELLKKVMGNPSRCGLRLPASAVGKPQAAYFADKIKQLGDMWVPTTPTDKPPGFELKFPFPAGLKLEDPGRIADAVTGTEAITPALPPQNPWVGTGSRPVHEAHVDSNEISDNHGGMPALFACCDDGDPHVALAMITVVGEDESDPERSLHRCIWYKTPEVDSNTGVATARYDAPDDHTFIGHPTYRLITADASLNHGTSQKSKVWKKQTGHLKMPKSAVAMWRTAVAEMAARNDPGRDAEPSDLVTEHVSRAKAARRARKKPRTESNDGVASSSA